MGFDTALLRLLLPAVLLIATVIRYNGFSFIYLCFLLACPLLPEPVGAQAKVHIQIFLIFLVTLSCIFTLSHPTLHIVLAVAPPYDDALKTCDDIIIASQIGVRRLSGMLFYRAMRLVLPDIVILATAVGILVYFSRRVTLSENRRSASGTMLVDNTGRTEIEPSWAANRSTETTDLYTALRKFYTVPMSNIPFPRDWDDNRRKLWRLWAFDTLCLLVNVVLICTTGIMSPSLPSSVYLLAFIGISTYWACRQKMNPFPFVILRIILAVYTALHVCVYYLYQFPFFQSICPDGSFLSRLFGLYYIMRTSCEKPGEIEFPQDLRTMDYIAPPLTLILHYMLVWETRRWINFHRRHGRRLIKQTTSNSTPSNTQNLSEHQTLLEVAQEVVSPVESMNLVNEMLDSYRSASTVHPRSRASIASIPVMANDTIRPASHISVDTTGQASNQVYSYTPETLETTDNIIPAAIPTTAQGESNIPPDKSESISPVSKNKTPKSRVIRLQDLGRFQPNLDILFGFTPPFVATLYGMDNAAIATTNNHNMRAERPLLLSLHCSAIRNSYIVTLIAMMAWSVTYRSWLSFILLLSACILWISPNARTSCLYTSPLIVLYGIVLVLIQYVYGMNLSQLELPEQITTNGMHLRELGMHKRDNSLGALSLQITFLVSFWFTLRLFINERSERRLRTRTHLPTLQTDEPATTSMVATPPEPSVRQPSLSRAGTWFSLGYAFGNVDNIWYRRFTEVMHGLCVKWWIVVCCSSMLFISIQQPVVIFRIFYMVMLLYFMFTFQISYGFWRRQMIIFWWILVLYSMTVVLCIYTYQFQGSPEFWQRTTKLSADGLKDIGLETFESGALFRRLLTPVLFLVFIILQLRYFHKPFLKRSALTRYCQSNVGDSPRLVALDDPPLLSSPHGTLRSHSSSNNLSNFIGDVHSAFNTVASKLTYWAVNLSNCCWRFFEIHWIKVVALVIVINSIKEVVAPNLISLTLLVVCFPFPSIHGFLATMIFVWTGMLALCKMCFQLDVTQFNLTINCKPTPNHTEDRDLREWIGFIKVDDFYKYIMPMGFLLSVCVVWHAIIYRQRQFYNNPRNKRPRDGIVFPDVTIKSLDYDLCSVVKFAANYGFYKFGLEICHCITVITACLRADAFSVLYLIMMLIFLFTPRHICAKLWLPYLTVMGILIPVQYAACVGLPPNICWSYPWITDSAQTDNLVQWLFLPGNYGTPTADKLMADFFQFAAVALQYQVFKIEGSADEQAHGGGSNKPVITDDLPTRDERDFVSSKESYLDYVRHMVFYWSYWLSLAIVLATGVTWITLFCLGYMILSFIYLWMGQNVMLRKRIQLIRSWNVIIGYNFLVILAKCSLQVIGCVYLDSMIDHCYFVQVIGVQCLDPLSWSRFNPPRADPKCTAVSSGLHWDVICFLFILFQRRVFLSQSFSHVVFDLNVQSQFASRGAYLINRKLMSVISGQAQREQILLRKIREKLDAIQMQQEAMGRNLPNITEHYIMLRSGDYYLFEGDPEEDDKHPTEDELDEEDSDDHVTKDKRRKTKVSSITQPSVCGGGHVRALSMPQDIRNIPSLHRTNGSGGGSKEKDFFYIPGGGGRNHPVTEALFNVEPSAMEMLSFYTDPYSISRDDSSVNNNRRLQTSYAAGRAIGHRRLRSHPEYLRCELGPNIQSSVQFSTDKSSDILRSVKTSPYIFPPEPSLSRSAHSPRNAMPSKEGSSRRKPVQTHRRNLSTSAVQIPTTSRSSQFAQLGSEFGGPVDRGGKHIAKSHIKEDRSSRPPFAKPLGLLSIAEASSLRSGRKPPTLAALGHVKRLGYPPESSTRVGRSRISHVDYPSPKSSSSDEASRGSNSDLTDEENEVNPVTSSVARLNPFELLNSAMEFGPCTAVRQYRRSLMSQPYSQHRTRRPSVHAETEPPSPIRQRHCSLQHFSISAPFASSQNGMPATKHQSGPSIQQLSSTDRPPEFGLNQSNRPWLPWKLKPPQLASLASVESDLAVSESVFNDQFETMSSADEQTSKITNKPIDNQLTNETKPLLETTRPKSIRRRSVTHHVRKPRAVPVRPNTKQTSQTLAICPSDPLTGVPASSVPSLPDRQSAAMGTEGYTVFEFPKLGSTSDPPPSDLDITEGPSFSSHQREEGCWSKFKALCVVVYLFFISSLNNLVHLLNGLTSEYRGIRRYIEKEKREVKWDVINSPRQAQQFPLQIEMAMYRVVSKSGESALKPMEPEQIETIGRRRPPATSGLDGFNRTQQQQRQKAFRQSRSRAFLLLTALANLAVVYAEWFCYSLLILNHMRSSSILSLPYPLMVFLWGMLSVPRPTKTFWIFLITYTEVVIVIKYIFQFKFVSFNDANEKPAESVESLWLPRLVGIDKNAHYAVFDLIQLIILFLHRGLLKNDGLWRDHTEFVHDLQLVAQGNKQSLDATPRSNADTNRANAQFPNAMPIVDMNIHNVARRSFAYRCNPFIKLHRFYEKMTDPHYNKKVDVYIYMFICEFIAFWIMIFGYVSFGPSTGMGDNAFEFIRSNRIPLPFISMIMVQFIFIIIDRGLFLRKQVLGKFIFQIIHVLLIHGWLFFILPHITKSTFTSGLAPQLLYLIKCIYFSLSAYQIRSGYPFKILGNFLTKNYNYINLVLFKGYLIIPFLYELRNVMDWMWTDSALSLYHWMELEDIYSKIFVLKCWRRSEVAYPTPRGVNRPAGKKGFVGGLLLAFFFICFWGPMTLSSFIGVTFSFNPPQLCSFSLSFGGFPPIFEFTSREGNILPVGRDILANFTQCYEKDAQTVGFLNNFQPDDVRFVKIDGFSGNIWAITPPSKDALLKKLADPESSLLLHFFMRCRRKTKEIQTSQTSVENIFSRPLKYHEKQQLLRILNKTTDDAHAGDADRNSPSNVAILNEVIPRYLLLKKDILRKAFAKLELNETHLNVSFIIHGDPVREQTWWELNERPILPDSDACFDEIRKSVLGSNVSVTKVLSMLTFNERVSDSLFGKVFSNYGIIGMYAAYIFLANRLLRTIYSNTSYIIRLEELPYVDRILNLCNEIYLVRENKLLRLEEKLVAKLFFLYRSSETMIKWTRHPKQLIEQFTGPPENDNGPPSPPQPSTPGILPPPPSTIVRQRSGSHQFGIPYPPSAPPTRPPPPRTEFFEARGRTDTIESIPLSSRIPPTTSSSHRFRSHAEGHPDDPYA